MISQRTKVALRAAKARGVVLGGDRAGVIAAQATKGAQASATVRAATAAKRANDLRPEIKSIQSEGATSLRQIAAVLNHRGIPTPRGQGGWNAVQVRRVMA
jgi:hypothetical protein